MRNSENGNKPLTLLVIEDDGAIRDIMKMMCDIWGFDIVLLRDGKQAQAYLEEFGGDEAVPDVALVDIRLPGLWGHELAAKMRIHPYLNNTGIILMTAYELSGENEAEYLTTSGADRLLYKPLPGMDELFGILKDVSARRRNGAGHHEPSAGQV